MDTIKIVNGTVWVFAVLLIGMVVIQAFLFLRLALRYNSKYQILSKNEISQAAKTGAIAAVGPGFSSLTVAVALCAMVGSGAAFMRCGVIGAPSYELMMAELSSQAAGVTFGTPEFTPGIFTLCLFGMTLASAPYFIVCILGLKPLDKLSTSQDKAKSKKRSFTPYMSDAAMVGLTMYMFIDYLKAGSSSIVAAIVAAAVMFAVTLVSRKIKNSTLESFGMAIAMIFGMFAGQVAVLLIG